MNPVSITIPQLSLVVLVGPSGAGKSTFARRHFLPTEILSSDFCRGLVSDDENSQEATPDAFDVLQYVAGKRLKAGKLTVIDATNVQPEARAPLVALAKSHDVLPVAIVLNLPERLCHERNLGRSDRSFGPHVVRNQISSLRRSLKYLQREGFRKVFVLSSPEEVEAASMTREPLWNDLRHERGPFDMIGDVHGCADELLILLSELGYVPAGQLSFSHPQGRKAVFLGDLVDRGPRVLDTLHIAMNMVAAGHAFCIPGNHDVKLLKALQGKNVRITHGLEQTLAEIEAVLEPERALLKQQLAEFLDALVSHYVLDDGRLVVAHAGMKAEYQGRASGRVREFALYGETTGETDEFGLPVRHNWAAEYRGRAMVVYGHTPVPEPEWLNHTINIDTGCVFGGKLTALRYPERELLQVPARRQYCEPARPFLPTMPTDGGMTSQQLLDEVLDIDDVGGKRLIDTRLAGSVTIRAENSTAALEVMSRFAANPKWLIYLPPTMSPSETTMLDGYLEHPAEAFAYYRSHDVPRVVCQEKHMGSRAVVIIGRDEEAVKKRLGIIGEGRGICFTRTGRPFFDDSKLHGQLLDRVHGAIDAAGWWDKFTSDWFCLDCELMPWSGKAQELLRRQYAPTGAAAQAMLGEASRLLSDAAPHRDVVCGQSLNELAQRTAARLSAAEKYAQAWRRYCWPVASIDDLRLAPFHLLASEGAVHSDKNHLWHMETLAELSAAQSAGSKLLMVTQYRTVDVLDEESVCRGIEWWESLTAAGGEGMVVKPLDWVQKHERTLVQPAVKCRGREYLRIIYGPEYDAEENLARLRKRGLGAKRSLAAREFALGIEALERFVRREPLRRVHECVFGVLALESEPVDPRL